MQNKPKTTAKRLKGQKTSEADTKTDARRGVALILMLLLLVYAGTNLYNGIRNGIAVSDFVSGGEIAVGTVVQLDQVEQSRLGGFGARIQTQPLVEFKTPDGKAWRFSNIGDCGRTCPAIGSTVPVIYNPGLPQQSTINTTANIWTAVAEQLLGSFAALIATFVAYLYTKPARNDLPRR